jgi:hypothetical protein
MPFKPGQSGKPIVVRPRKVGPYPLAAVEISELSLKNSEQNQVLRHGEI